MARRPRNGGVRAGTPGVAYPNRTDLNANRSLPVARFPGQTYGAQVQQVNAQRLVPMGAPPTPMGGVGGAAPGGLGAPPASPAGSPMPPGSLTPLNAPSQRPNEPVTAGARLGPGPGPEVLPQGGALTGGAMTALLNRAAVSSGSSSLRSLAMTAAQQGK